MQSESVFAFMHVACVHIYLREHLCVCVTVRMRDAHKMPSENKSLYSTPSPPPPSFPFPSPRRQTIHLCTQLPWHSSPAACCLLPDFCLSFIQLPLSALGRVLVVVVVVVCHRHRHR